MIETLDLHEDPFWQERVEKFYGWYHKSSKTSKAAWTWEEGKDTSNMVRELKALPGDINLFQSIRQIVRIQRRRQLHSETLEISIPAMTTSIRRIQSRSAQFQKLTSLRQSSSKPYMQWIEKILGIDRRMSKDPRLYCAYCDIEQPSEILMQSRIQASGTKCEAPMHIVRRPSPSISMLQGTDQWWRCKAHLVQD